MCTVSIFATDGGVAVTFNRDEQRTRAKAEPPSWRAIDSTRAIWPTDPKGGGTWIAASAAGVIVGVVNRAWPAPTAATARPSRGEIPLIGVGAPDAVSAIQRIAQSGPERWDGFEAFAVDADAIVHGLLWDGAILRVQQPQPGPWCLTSSSLGRHVEVARRHLFETMLARHGATLATQERFHLHRWNDRPESSVCMSRPDACTVSMTSVALEPGRAPVMRYDDEDTVAKRRLRVFTGDSGVEC